MNTYKIVIKGNGYNRGLGRINEFQYSFWANNNKEDLLNALTKNYNYEHNHVPLNSVFEYDYYHDYDDVAFWSGFGEDAWLTVTTDNNEQIVDEDLISYLHSQFDDEVNDILDISYEFVPEHDLQEGNYVEWVEEVKEYSFVGSFCDQTFDPKKLKFEGLMLNDKQYIITNVYYNDVEIENTVKLEHDVDFFDCRVINVT
jgi:hypothetical protein